MDRPVVIIIVPVFSLHGLTVGSFSGLLHERVSGVAAVLLTCAADPPHDPTESYNSATLLGESETRAVVV